MELAQDRDRGRGDITNECTASIFSVVPLLLSCRNSGTYTQSQTLSYPRICEYSSAPLREPHFSHSLRFNGERCWPFI
jgi:hypothetical protein